MRIIYENELREQLRAFPPEVREKFYKQVEFLKENIRHPSLRAKKYGGVDNIWQARVDKNVRFYFKIEDGVYRLLRILRHPK